MGMRAGAAAFGLLLVGVTGYPAADARAPVAEARIDAPSGDYLLRLHVYADDDAYASASAVVMVKYKPTPTPLSILLPGWDDIPTPVAVSTREPVPVPNEPPPALNVGIAPIEASAPAAPELAPIPPIASAGAIVPIQPIPLDANNPGPFPVDSPTIWSPGQLPGDPAPVYLTPINFDLPMN